MSETEKLRALLDERGVRHTDFCNVTTWKDSCGRKVNGYELNGGINLRLTPGQAIAATLGKGECENLIDPWSVHESFENDFECSACHASGHANGNIDHGEFLYCPRCGAKVRKEAGR